MKYSFSNTEKAIDTIIDASVKHAQATETGDYKTANKNYHLINNAITYLLENKNTEELEKLLIHDETSVKVWVASYLIKQGDQHAIAVLEQIASQSIPDQSFDAKILLQQWREGKLQ